MEVALSNPSVLVPGRNCTSVGHADRVAFLIDGAAYFSAFQRAAEQAERSITILAWDFNSCTRLDFDEDDGSGVPPELGDFLDFLVRRRRRLHIHVLNWDYPIVFSGGREAPPGSEHGWSPHRRVHVRFDNTQPFGGCHHQKVVVIDDRLAFAGGLDLTCRRWDTPEHIPDDCRRVAYGDPYAPFHDVMVAVDGEAARQLGALARARWRKATGRKLRAVKHAGDPWPPALPVDLTDVDVGISCTLPAHDGSDGVRHIETLYLDMIAAARKTIYIENQYFTCQKIGDAIAARLAEPDGPEIVVVSRLLSHGWLEEATMHVLRAQLIERLRAADRHGRFFPLYPHVDNLAEGTCIDVHSKVMVIDDECLRIGSSNLCGRSMGLDTECDLVIEARGEPRVAERIRDFRNQLIAEHSATTADEVAARIERLGSVAAAIETIGTPSRKLLPLRHPVEPSGLALALASAADLEKPIGMKLSEALDFSGGGKRSGIPWLTVAVVLAFCGGLTLAWRFTPLSELVTAENVRSWAGVLRDSAWTIPAIVLAYTPASFIMFPRPLLTLAAVLAFGAWGGFFLALLGILIAGLASYAAGKKMKRATIHKLAGRRLVELSSSLRKRGLLAVTALRLVPIAPFPVVGILAGALRIGLWHFSAGTVLGNVPGTLAATVFGDQLESALSDPSSVNWWLVAGAAIVLVTGSLLVGRWLHEGGRRERGDAGKRDIAS